jgi:ATP/maltotriose-dependent transcriptional regulator MalT
MLAEADTIQKAKELKNLALTAADWAKRKGMGEEAIQYARSYALEAERKLGKMLKQTERADGGDAQRTRLHCVTELPPTHPILA